MEKKAKKIIQHRFLNRHTIIGAILLMAFGLFMPQIIEIPLSLIIWILFHGDPTKGGLSIAIGSLIVLWAYKRWFYPEFEGNLRGGDPKTGLKLMLFLIAALILTIPVDFLFGGAVFGAPTLGTIGLSLQAGFMEETAFRGLPVSYLMRQWRDERKIVSIMLLTSLSFGALHVINTLAGAPLIISVTQAIAAAGGGFFFCAVYLRCGNLWVTIFAHFFFDVINMLDVAGINEGVVQYTSLSGALIWDAGVQVLLGLVGFWLVRPAVRGQIRSLWDQKWNVARDFDEV